MGLGTLVLAVLLGSLLLYGVAAFNSLVADRNRLRNAFAQIDVHLLRRYDLLPNLVETAKGYMQHERETLEAVTLARNQAVQAARGAAQQPDGAGAVAALSAAEGVLGAALGRFHVVAEAYPALQADVSMAALMDELATTENGLATARRAFNDAVTAYNNRREQFPTNLVAGLFAFASAELFTLDNPAARETPRIAFN